MLDLFERIERPGAISRSYLNLTQYADLFFRDMAASEVLPKLGLALDPEQLPKELGAEIRVVSEVNESLDGTFLRSEIVHFSD